MFVGKFGKTAVSLLAAITVSLVFTVGCSDDDDGPSGGGLETAMGWEWAACEWDDYDDEEWCDIIMLRPNGEIWELDGGAGSNYWMEFQFGEWSELSNNRLRITVSEDGTGFFVTVDYELSNNGNTLTIWFDGDDEEPTVFTRQRSHRPNGGGGNLVLSADQAWIDDEDCNMPYYCYGMIFRSNGTVQFIYHYYGTWEIDEEGTYTTSSGGILNIDFPYGKARTNYSVSGNSLIIGFDGGWEYTRTNNIVIGGGNDGNDDDDDDGDDDGDDTGELDSRLILPDGRAWVDDWPTGMRDGYIFNADGSFVNIVDDYDGVFYVDGRGTWSTSGNNRITMTMFGISRTDSYTVSGNTLIIDGDYVLTNTSVIISDDDWDDDWDGDWDDEMLALICAFAVMMGEYVSIDECIDDILSGGGFAKRADLRSSLRARKNMQPRLIKSMR